MTSIRFTIFVISINTACWTSIATSIAAPGITLLATPSRSQNCSLNLTCVAGPDVRGSAITFIPPLTDDHVMRTPVSTYKSAQGSEYKDEYNCDFEPGSGCVTEWTQTSSTNIIAATSGQHDLALVTDERWENSYLSLAYSQQWQNMGPTLKPDSAGRLCVALHVATFYSSMLKLRFHPTPDELEQVFENNSQGMQQWQLIRLYTKNVQQNIIYKLQVLTEKKELDSSGFWLIDNVRRCHDDETRVISTTAPMLPSDIVSCQALQQPKWWSSHKIEKVHSDLAVCDNETHTGSKCSISCVSALGKNCSRLIVCEPDMDRSSPKCTCAAGYQGDQCQDVCPQNYYGSGCIKECDTTCKETCTPSTGMCSKTNTKVPGRDNTDANSTTGIDSSHIQSASNPALYSLLLLLLIIPAIGWFAYWKMKRPVNTVPNVLYTAVSNEQNIILINDSSQSNPQTKVNTSFKNEIKKEENSNSLSEGTVNLTPSKGITDKKQNHSKIVKISNFSNYVKQSIENGELEKQFKSLPEGETKPWNVGTSKENIQKNRYKNITAYDHSRVVLNTIPGDPYSDFINANYVDGYKQNKAYIATQGPKKSTVDDFWRMIWQENVACIVMVANLVEGGKVKCEKYWPDIGTTDNYGLIYVTFEETDIYADFEYRIFKVRKENKIRQVQQYQFTSWPDHGVPLYPQSLVPFLNTILAISPAEAPIVVHCSAGIGRTGTIILADICLRMAAAENQIDVYRYFHSIRQNRVNMVAKYDQYLLVHMVLLECLLTPETSYSCNELSKTVEEIIRKGEIEKQIQYLKDTAWHNQVMGTLETYDTANNSKNRFPDIVPKGRRIYLSKSEVEDKTSDYINAVPVDGFRIKNQFIVTQNPLPHTVKDFWRMITEFNVKVIVSLNEIMMNDETSSKFWPEEEEEIAPLPYLTLKCQKIINENYYKVYKIKLEDISKTGVKVVNIVNVIQFKNWKYEQFTPSSVQQFIGFIHAAQKLSRQDGPVVVTCYDGARASGLYVAISFVIEKIKLEQICDVCLAVRTVRNNREQFVNDNKQFEFIYKAAVQFVSTFNLYSNFNPSSK